MWCTSEFSLQCGPGTSRHICRLHPDLFLLPAFPTKKNSSHHQFEIAWEVDDKLPFLDLMIYCSADHFPVSDSEWNLHALARTTLSMLIRESLWLCSLVSNSVIPSVYLEEVGFLCQYQSKQGIRPTFCHGSSKTDSLIACSQPSLHAGSLLSSPPPSDW